MIDVTLTQIPAQQLSVVLSEQRCNIRIYQHSIGVCIDLYVNGAPIIEGVLCLNGNKLVRYKHLGFAGDLVFVDTQGDSNPEFSGLGTRYKLYYLDESEL